MNHPIDAPSNKLVDEWAKQYERQMPEWVVLRHVAADAARWGADQELAMCIAEVCESYGDVLAELLRTARRPKPPSLKQQAIAALQQVEADFKLGGSGDTIRRALEALPND